MQVSRSAFKSGIKLRILAANSSNGIKKNHPFLNVWSNETPQHRQISYTPSLTATHTMASATSFFDFSPKDKKEKEYPLSQHKGKVILAVNTASKCGFTPQFKGLEQVWKTISAKYPEKFVIIGFPCNQFNNQDPGNNDTIQEFCQVNYGVTFPVLGKTDVNGDKAEPVYEWMKNEKPGLMGLKRIKWNFEKFLIGKDGKVIQRYSSVSKPETLEKDIVKEIEKADSKM